MAQKVALTDIGYMILYVNDMNRSTAFYRDVLGIPIGNASPEWTELGTKGTVLALHRHDGKVPKGMGQAEVVFNVSDVLGVHAALVARDLKLSPPKKVWEGGGVVGVAASFADPDGNLLSIHGTVPEGKWKD